MIDGALYKNMLDNIYDGIYFVDKDRQITFWNKGAERISGFSAEEVVNRYCYDNILNHVDEDGRKLCLDGCPLHDTIQDRQMREGSMFLQHKDGHRVPVSIRAISLEENNKLIGVMEVFVDNSQHYEALKYMEEYKTLAMIDQLTGIPNRRYIDSYMNSRFMEFTTLDINFGVMFVDIDRFKDFNDTYGHATGDKVLKMVANTMTSSVRSADLVGRYGGEEFVVVVPGIDKHRLEPVAQKLRRVVEASSLRNEMEGKELSVTISIGATMIHDSDTIDTVLRRADALLYRSKQDGRNRVTTD